MTAQKERLEKNLKQLEAKPAAANFIEITCEKCGFFVKSNDGIASRQEEVMMTMAHHRAGVHGEIIAL